MTGANVEAAGGRVEDARGWVAATELLAPLVELLNAEELELATDL